MTTPNIFDVRNVFITEGSTLQVDSLEGPVNIIVDVHAPDNQMFFIDQEQTAQQRTGYTLSVSENYQMPTWITQSDQIIVNPRTYQSMMSEPFSQSAYRPTWAWLEDPIKELRKTKGFRKFHR